MSITDLVYFIKRKYETTRKSDRFFKIGVGFPSFPNAHALILEDERLIDLEMKILESRNLYDERTESKYTSARVSLSPKRIIYSHDEAKKISEMVSLIFEYEDNCTVIVGIGSSMNLLKKSGILAKNLVIGYDAYQKTRKQ